MKPPSWCIAAIAAGLPALAVGMTPAIITREDDKRCSALENRQVGPGTVLATTLVRPPYATRWMNSTRTATADEPFCRVEGFIDAAPRSHIEFEVWLPVRSRWNGRFLGVGAGGSMGAINTVDLATGVNRGFAVVATDNGHRSPGPRDDNQWALHARERIIDFGHRAHRLAALAGKAAVAAFYDSDAKFSYYYGCSQGGLKGLMSAQRYPEDYDGIIAGAPVYSWVDEMTQQAWTVRALTETPRSALSINQMQALHDAVHKRCANENGLIMDPRSCDFDPGALECPQPANSTCLTREQVAAVRKIYQGPRTSTGQQTYPGFARGSERGWENLYGEVEASGVTGGGSWLGVYRYMVFDDPHWTLPQLDFDEHPKYAKQKIGALLDADSEDLTAYAARGGKLIVFHGWADQQVPAHASLDYRVRVVDRISRERADVFFRLFMVPGMAHCMPESVAPSDPAPLGPNLVLLNGQSAHARMTPENDALTALQRWVEHGQAPSKFEVRVQHDAAGMTPRTVLACAEPARARWKGTGDAREVSEWECMDSR